jgi:hypothetical protein
MRWVLWSESGDDVESMLESAVTFMQRGIAPDQGASP